MIDGPVAKVGPVLLVLNSNAIFLSRSPKMVASVIAVSSRVVSEEESVSGLIGEDELFGSVKYRAAKATAAPKQIVAMMAKIIARVLEFFGSSIGAEGADAAGAGGVGVEALTISFDTFSKFGSIKNSSYGFIVAQKLKIKDLNVGGFEVFGGEVRHQTTDNGENE